MTKHSKYCENCDKWLDNESDLNKGQSMISGFEPTWCKLCDDRDKSSYPFVCGTCKKPVDSETNLNKAKPNYKKRVLVAHDYKEETSLIKTFNHDCFVKCENNQGGKSCGKDWKVTKENYPLLQANAFYFFSDNSCIDCRIEYFEEQIAEARKQGKDLNDEGKRYYEQLKKFAGKNDDPQRERERERRFWPIWSKSNNIFLLTTSIR